MDKRAYPSTLRTARSGSGQRRLIGHAAVFGAVSQDLGGFREVILPGAFTAAIQRSDIRALFNHDANQILGRVKSGTLTVREDGRGLLVEIVPPDTTFANDLLASIDRGDIDQMSFAFTVQRGGDRWYDQDGQTVREISAVDQLFDVSPVTYPAYEQTDVGLQTRQAFDEFRRNGGAGGSAGLHRRKIRLSSRAERESALSRMESEVLPGRVFIRLR